MLFRLFRRFSLILLFPPISLNSKSNLSYPDDETHASVQRGESPRFFFVFFANSVFVDPFLKFRPGRARAQAGLGPKPGPGPSRARAQKGHNSFLIKSPTIFCLTLKFRIETKTDTIVF